MLMHELTQSMNSEGYITARNGEIDQLANQTLIRLRIRKRIPKSYMKLMMSSHRKTQRLAIRQTILFKKIQDVLALGQKISLSSVINLKTQEISNRFKIFM